MLYTLFHFSANEELKREGGLYFFVFVVSIFFSKKYISANFYWENNNYLSWQHTSGIIKKGIQRSLM